MPLLTRRILREMVWTKPVRDVAAGFGISDVGLKKICLRFDIPVPERGYWARLAAGRTVLKRKLPPRGPGMSDRIEIGPQPQRYYYNLSDAQIEEQLAEPEPIEPVFDEAIEGVEARVRALVGKVPTIRTLDAACPPVRKLLDKDDERRAKQAASSYPSAYDAPLFESPFEPAPPEGDQQPLHRGDARRHEALDQRQGGSQPRRQRQWRVRSFRSGPSTATKDRWGRRRCMAAKSTSSSLTSAIATISRRRMSGPTTRPQSWKVT